MKKIITKMALTFFFWVLISGAALADALNLNTAGAEEIAEVMTGIGKVKADAIVKDREANGKFKSIEDLTRVKGIGPATIEKNRDKIKVE